MFDQSSALACYGWLSPKRKLSVISKWHGNLLCGDILKRSTGVTGNWLTSLRRHFLLNIEGKVIRVGSERNHKQSLIILRLSQAVRVFGTTIALPGARVDADWVKLPPFKQGNVVLRINAGWNRGNIWYWMWKAEKGAFHAVSNFLPSRQLVCFQA